MRNVTVINTAKVRAIATKLGLSVKEKKSEFKIFGVQGIGKSIAVPNTKGGASRIYLVGFESNEGTVAHPKPPAKTVTQMFDHSLPETVILKSIYKALRTLATKRAPAPAPVVEAPVEVTEVQSIDGNYTIAAAS